MSDATRIEWTDATFNPWWGCAHVSPGCVNCYAETLAARYGHDIWGKQGPRRIFGPSHWAEPLKWDRKAKATGVRKRVFCGSMCDVFEDHPALPEERHRLWELIEQTTNLDWQLLTKRPENGERMTPWPTWYGDVWLGTSVEDQRRADERIPHLVATGAQVKFLSCEPLIGPIDLRPWLHADELHWVIVGGESGPRRRPMELNWLHRIVVHCEQAGIPCFVKQDCAPRSGQQGRIPDDLWRIKEFPESVDLIW